MKRLLLVIAVALLFIGCSSPPAKACNGVGVGVSQFDQFGNPFGASFVSPSIGFNSFSSFNSAPVFIPQNVGFNSVGFNSFAFNPLVVNNGFNAFAVGGRRGGLIGSRVFASPFVGASFVSPSFVGFNSFNRGFNVVNANVGFNNFAVGRFGAVRPLAVSRAGTVGVRGIFGGFHPFRANGVPTLLPRFR